MFIFITCEKGSFIVEKPLIKKYFVFLKYFFIDVIKTHQKRNRKINIIIKTCIFFLIKAFPSS